VSVVLVLSLGVLQWWDGELERGYLLYRARTLHDACTVHQQTPTHPLPSYLEARAAGLALPWVTVAEGQQEGAGGQWGRKRTVAPPGVQQQERHAITEWAMKPLSGELFMELMQGFHGPPM
jgi:hypothetical protein